MLLITLIYRECQIKLSLPSIQCISRKKEVPKALYCTTNCLVMHQSFVSKAPFGPVKSGAFNFSVFTARLKAWHCGAIFVVKDLLKAPAPRRLKIKFMEQQLVYV